MRSGVSGADDVMTIADTQGLDDMLADVTSAAGLTRDVFSVASSMRRDLHTPRGVTPGISLGPIHSERLQVNYRTVIVTSLANRCHCLLWKYSH